MLSLRKKCNGSILQKIYKFKPSKIYTNAIHKNTQPKNITKILNLHITKQLNIDLSALEYQPLVS